MMTSFGWWQQTLCSWVVLFSFPFPWARWWMNRREIRTSIKYIEEEVEKKKKGERRERVHIFVTNSTACCALCMCCWVWGYVGRKKAGKPQRPHPHLVQLGCFTSIQLCVGLREKKKKENSEALRTIHTTRCTACSSAWIHSVKQQKFFWKLYSGRPSARI